MLWSTRSVSEMRDELVELEAEISHVRCRQHVLVNELDKVNAAAGDGYRSSVDWLSARLDIDRSTASDLVYAARWSKWHQEVEDLLADGVISFDRTVAMLRLAVAGADREVVDDSRRLDLAGVKRLAARQRRITRGNEHTVFVDRFVSIQPTLDEALWQSTGLLPAVDGKIVEQALHARADELHTLPGGEACTRAQRQADSLVAMAHDSLDRHSNTDAASSGPSVSIFIDLDEANGTGGERGAAIEDGPRSDPPHSKSSCVPGRCRSSAWPMAAPSSRPPPAAIRRHVAHRDGGCVIADCTSRYRLQPHHIVHRANGGSHDPDNLATLCWFHHHIAIHQHGLGIDPDSPPQRRRLIRRATGTDPPG